MDVFADVCKKVRPSVRVIDWSVARKKVLDPEDETKDDWRNGGGGSDRDINRASYRHWEGKGRSEPGEVVGEVLSNEAATMLVDDAFEFLSEA